MHPTAVAAALAPMTALTSLELYAMPQAPLPPAVVRRLKHYACDRLLHTPAEPLPHLQARALESSPSSCTCCPVHGHDASIACCTCRQSRYHTCRCTLLHDRDTVDKCRLFLLFAARSCAVRAADCCTRRQSRCLTCRRAHFQLSRFK